MDRISQHVPAARARLVRPRPAQVTPSTVQADDLRHLYLGALAFRFGAGILGWLLTLMIHIPFLEDAFYYEQLGAGIARDWLAGRPSEWLAWAWTMDRTPWLLPTLIGCFYWLTGGIRLVPLLLLAICAITALTPVLTYLIARQIGLSRRGAKFAGALVAFSPAFAFWSGGFYKEGFILLLLNLGMYHVLRLQRVWRWDSMLILAACLFGLFGLRFYLAAMMSAIVLLGLVLGRSKSGDGALTVFRQVLILAGFAGLLFGFGLTARVRRILPTDVSEAMSTVETSRHDLANSADSGFARNVNLTTPAQALAFLPLGMGYFMFSPLPWQLGQVRQNLVIPETAFWIGLYPLMALGVARGLKRDFQSSGLLLAAAIPISCLYTMFCGNIGTVYRMRIQVWLLLAIFAGWGWEAWKERLENRDRRFLRSRSQSRLRRRLGGARKREDSGSNAFPVR
jgi:hypothetical protein